RLSRGWLRIPMASRQGTHLHAHGVGGSRGHAARQETRVSAGRTVAVTGAAGFVGGARAPGLAPRRFPVRALVRDTDAASPLPGMERARCALPDGIDPASLAGADVLLHAAWATRETDAAKARLVNEEGTRRLLEAARQAGVRSRAFISSIA